MLKAAAIKALPAAKVAPIAAASVYLGAMAAEATQQAAKLDPEIGKILAGAISALLLAVVRWFEIKILKTRTQKELSKLHDTIEAQADRIAKLRDETTAQDSKTRTATVDGH